jgi:hypothetical protein
MKRILITIIFLLLPTTSYAAGPFDGIYSFSVSGFLGGYASIHEDGANNMIAVLLEPDPNDTTWEAISGVRNGNNVTLRSIPGAGTVSLDVSVTFFDSNSGTATVNSCIGDCDFPSGTVLDVNRIF